MAELFQISDAANAWVTVHLSDGTCVFAVRRSVAGNDVFSLYHSGSDHKTPTLIANLRLAGTTSLHGHDIVRDASDNIYHLGQNFATAYVKGSGHTWTAKPSLNTNSGSAGMVGLCGVWCNTGGGTNGKGHIMVIFTRSTSPGYVIYDAGQLLTAVTGQTLGTPTVGPTFLGNGGSADVNDTRTISQNGFGVSSGIASVPSGSASVSVGAWSVTPGGALGTNVSIVGAMATGAISGAGDNLRHRLVRVSPDRYILLYRSTVDGTRHMAALFSSAALVAAGVDSGVRSNVIYRAHTTGWDVFADPNIAGKAWLLTYRQQTPDGVGVLGIEIFSGANVSWGTGESVVDNDYGGSSSPGDIAAVKQPTGGYVDFQACVARGTAPLRGDVFELLGVAKWQVGSIRMGVFPLPPKTVPSKSSSNGVYFRMNASPAVRDAFGGSFDWRFEYSHVAVSGGGQDTETLFAWGAQDDDGILFRNGNNNTGAGIPGITVVLYGPGSPSAVSFDITLTENVFDYSIRRTLRVTRNTTGETWTVYTGSSVNGPWTQIGQVTRSQFTVGSELSSAYFLSRGIPQGLGIQDASSGRMYKMRLYGDSQGSTPAVVNADFTQVRDAPAQNVAGSFTDYAGILWEYQTVDFIDPATP